VRFLPRLRHVSELLCITGVLVLGAACKRNEKTTDASATDGNADADAGGSSPLRVVSSGLGAKRNLSYKIPERMTSSMVMHVDVSVTIERVEVEPRQVALPTVRLVVDSTKPAVARSDRGEPDASFPVDTIIREARLATVAGVPPELIRSMGEELRTLSGARSRGTMTNQGHRTQEPFVLSEAGGTRSQILEAVELAIELMSPPFPDRPLGVGASWQLDQESVVSGIKMRERLTYELDDLAQHTGRLKVKIEQEADRQPSELPGLPKETAAAELVGLKGNGQGEIDFDLESLTPLGARIAVQDEIDYRQKAAGDQGALRVKSSVVLRIEKL
jgi:hypothetical protein